MLKITFSTFTITNIFIFLLFTIVFSIIETNQIFLTNFLPIFVIIILISTLYLIFNTFDRELVITYVLIYILTIFLSRILSSNIALVYISNIGILFLLVVMFFTNFPFLNKKL
jgi:hypothetical protein